MTHFVNPKEAGKDLSRTVTDQGGRRLQLRMHRHVEVIARRSSAATRAGGVVIIGVAARPGDKTRPFSSSPAA